MTDWVDRAVEYIKNCTGPVYVGIDWRLPTVRELAKRFGRTQQDVLDTLDRHKNLRTHLGKQLAAGDYSFEWLGEWATEPRACGRGSQRRAKAVT